MRRSTKGITLLECLVLFAVVAILAVILFPVFASARQTTHDKTCLSNLRSLSRAVLMYAADNDGRAPGVEHPMALYAGQSTIRNEYVAWEVLIDPYLPSRDLFSCPANPDWCIIGRNAKDPSQICMYSVPMPASWKGVSVGYSMNVLLQQSTNVDDPASSWYNWDGMATGKLPASAGWGGLNLSRLSAPERVMMLCDANMLADACGIKINWPNICAPKATYDGGRGCWEEGGKELQDPSYARHNGGNNWAYADGHARWVWSGMYRCIPGGNSASDSDILIANSMQKIHGVDQLN